MGMYKSTYTGPQIDSAVGRALPGGAIDLSLSNKANQADVDASLSNNAADHPHRNLLDNWDFRNPVNQRGVTTLSPSTSNTYFIDRWYISRVVATVGVNGISMRWDGINSTNGWIQQKIENSSALIGAECTASVEIDGTIHSVVGMFSTTTNATNTYKFGTDYYINLSNLGGRTASFVIGTFSTVANVFSRVKLELGSVSTLANDPLADYGEELRKCQRYYFQRHFVQYETIAMGYLGDSWLNLVLGIGSPMRTDTPTLSVSGALSLVGAGASAAPTPVNVACSGCSANLGFSTIASTQGACYAYPSDAGGATISLSADL